jgi:multidrug efflux pump subunit AcrA (membrane-fusion protein)
MSIVVVGSFLSGCSNSKETVAAKETAPAVAVGTAEVQLRPMAQHLTVSSELVPFQEIDVYAKEAGYVKQLNVDFGSHVRAETLWRCWKSRNSKRNSC